MMNMDRMKLVISDTKRKILLLLLITAISGIGFSQDVSIDKLKKVTTALFAETAKTTGQAGLTTGFTGSSYIGNFPHFSAGLAVGVAISNVVQIAKIATGLQNESFNFTDLFKLQASEVPSVGLSAPLLFRVGGVDFVPGPFYLPFDVGVKLMFLPPISTPIESLKFGFVDFGIDVRVPLFEEQRLVPGLTAGLSYTVNTTHFGFSLPTSELLRGNNTIGEGATAIEFEISDIAINFDLYSHIFALTFQSSKRIWFLESFLGLTTFMGSAGGGFSSKAFDFKVKSAFTNNQFVSYKDYLDRFNEIVTLKNFFKVDGDNTKIDITDIYFTGGIKVTTGLVLHIWSLKVDVDIGYELIKSTLTAKVGTRFAM